MPEPVVVEVPARAALAGNPSDLYGGAVLAVPVPSLRARIEVTPGPGLTIDGDEGARHLVEAAAARTAFTGTIRWSSTIPVAVGLAGSSAIVIGVLRATTSLTGLDLALLAQAVERDDLGINAGVQDRVVQAFEQPVLVDVSGDTPQVTTLSPARPVRILVAWLAAAAGDSGAYHDALRESAPDMTGLAATAHRAASAFAAGNADALAREMTESARLRRIAAPLSPSHERLASEIERAGLSPNSAGSGGAVAAVAFGGATVDADHVIETYG
jgi:glucuronokinase